MTIRKKKQASARRPVYTIGHSTRTLDELVSVLRAHGVQHLIDVRAYPHSRTNPQFNRDTLGPYLRARSIGYRSVSALGGRRRASPSSKNDGWRSNAFRGFADYMETDDFLAGLDAVLSRARKCKTVIMCAELLPWRCHRFLISDALTIRRFNVLHILNEGPAREHVLNPMARVRGMRIRYRLVGSGGIQPS
ncbi:MAG: DUF488 domain-containing protein [Bdellovibrionota bacterium]